ncbi:MAG: hypothetical protein CM1200mP3_16960 [Chloroflexota bacterium]|nr:MAG: hypothetical protein CM1200mP3_16960 [Chloroflexota bacterium]
MVKNFWGPFPGKKNLGIILQMLLLIAKEMLVRLGNKKVQIFDSEEKSLLPFMVMRPNYLAPL